jgi:(S)-mandelate dehydrogenase
MSEPVSVEYFRKLAQNRLPKMVFDYLDGGAEDEYGLARNRRAFQRLSFYPRRLTDVSKRDISTTLLGKSIAAPLLIAPTGLNAIFWPRGDIELARAAEKTGIPFVLSTASNASIEELAGEAGGELWFQLYVLHRALADQLVTRALNAGYKTLVLTTDVALNGKRERDLRNGFGLPLRYTPCVVLDGLMHPRWSWSMLRHGMPQLRNFVSDAATDVEMQAALMNRQMDASFNWDDLSRLRDRWPHRLLVKGIVHAEDVARCLNAGADGVILSNHGGRQLDDSISPLDLLPTVARQHQEAPGILLDSGIRRGSDVVKAVALGANAVLLGRATLYGLAVNGAAGATRVIEIIKDEIDKTIALLGCSNISELGPQHLCLSPQTS